MSMRNHMNQEHDKNDRRNSGGTLRQKDIDREKERKRERKRERKEREKREKERKLEKKTEKERKGRKERCPHDVPKILLAEMLKTIDILAEMSNISKSGCCCLRSRACGAPVGANNKGESFGFCIHQTSLPARLVARGHRRGRRQRRRREQEGGRRATSCCSCFERLIAQ